MKLLIINGPNINMLGIRNKNVYGTTTYRDLIKQIKRHGKDININIKFYQSNSESSIITFIHKSYNKYDGFIVNLGAFTHYSYAIRDALELVSSKIVEIHISDIYKREEFRKVSVIEDIASFRVIGKGTDGYIEAINYFVGENHVW